jgi:DUF1365 family protein
MLYPCTITHSRKGSVARIFTYKSYLWLVDLDRPPVVPAPLRPLAGFAVADHLGTADAPSIRANVDEYLHDHGIDCAGGRVLMLANARTFGYVFNPLSVFWCFDAAGALAAVLAEVHNTYGERHVYLLRPDESGRAGAAKEFYVSPFLPMAGRYLMRLPVPAQTLRLGITLLTDDATKLVAGVSGRRRPYSVLRLIAYSLRFPLAPVGVSLLIRWQGIRLWARRVPITPRTRDKGGRDEVPGDGCRADEVPGDARLREPSAAASGRGDG